MRGAKVLLLVAVTATLASCGWLSRTYRYEMVIETHSPRGVERWSGVREVVRHMSERAYSYDWKGEAIPIGLGNGQFAYALPISSDHSEAYSSIIFNWFLGERAGLMGRIRGVELWPKAPDPAPYGSLTPMFVRFANDADPNSLEVIDIKPDHAEIAPGVTVSKILIRRTNKPLHFSIPQRLPWLRQELEPSQSGPPWHPLPELPNRLYYPDFIKGAHPVESH